ncbi:biotin-dependent carboxyltransferase family protein [Nitrincola alkalilacustris]|uniref:5-oxoprolinase subunit C family protein n=1 Tax=Nitrincola alkalilacustris TaxID=1571224 RepID=UPI00124E7042|nr:biotin-dependent carboxyltransferase family protein [Nitrincola alkalilacustris]
MTTTHTSGHLNILRAGPLALLQDSGRFGVRRLGITQGGPADLHAWAWANRLLDNPWGNSVLEITLGGLELQAEHDCQIAICGGDLGATIDQQPAPLWQTIILRRHQILRFRLPISGVRAYLAVKGGFDAAMILGSRSCVTRDGLGGHKGDGSKIGQDDKLYFAAHTPDSLPARQLPESEHPDYSQQALLDLIPGAQIAEFRGDSLYQTFNHGWQVDTRADRMGIRLKGPVLQCHMKTMISEGISLGAVQVPPDGQPIVLLNDRQTIGGYPRLGTLTPLACARLAQCPPGHSVRFRATGLLAAQAEQRRFRSGF